MIVSPPALLVRAIVRAIVAAVVFSILPAACWLAAVWAGAPS